MDCTPAIILLTVEYKFVKRKGEKLWKIMNAMKKV